MYDSHSKGISYTAGFFMLIAFTIAGIIAANLVTEQIWVQMTGKNIKVLHDNEMQPEDGTAMMIIQVVTQLIGFFLPAVVTAAMLNRRPMNLLGFSPRIMISQSALTIIIIFVAMLISVFAVAYFNREVPLPANWKIQAEKLEQKYNHLIDTMLRLKSVSDYIIALLVMALIPALCEETLFRGGLQNFLTRSTGMPWFSIIVVSLIFSAVHFSFFGFLPRLFLGAVLGLLYHYSGRLWLSILAHFINNAFAVSVLYMSTQQGVPMEEALKTNNGGWWGIFLLPVLVVLFIFFRKISDQKYRPQHGI